MVAWHHSLSPVFMLTCCANTLRQTTLHSIQKAWGIFANQRSNLSPAELAELEHYVDLNEAAADVKFAQEHRASVASMKPSHDPIGIGTEVFPVPLALYAAVAMGDFCTGPVTKDRNRSTHAHTH